MELAEQTTVIDQLMLRAFKVSLDEVVCAAATVENVITIVTVPLEKRNSHQSSNVMQYCFSNTSLLVTLISKSRRDGVVLRVPANGMTRKLESQLLKLMLLKNPLFPLLPQKVRLL